LYNDPKPIVKKYVVGEPGEPWTAEEMWAIRKKIFVFCGFHKKSYCPAILRLAFHDCIPTVYGKGGCNGGIDFTNMYHRHQNCKKTFCNHGGCRTAGFCNAYKTGPNVGLHAITAELEKIYTEVDYPAEAPRMDPPLVDRFKSRADFWAFAGMVAVEYGTLLNNQVCDEFFAGFNHDSTFGSTCHPREGQPDCYVHMPPFQFKSGRRDWHKHYYHYNKEAHPSPFANGKTTVDYLKQFFNFSVQESVAMLGAHTYGGFHHSEVLYHYTWKTKSTALFNNGYYHILTGKRDWFFFPGSDCRVTGDQFGQRALAHFRVVFWGNLATTGPMQWIQEKVVCDPAKGAPYQNSSTIGSRVRAPKCHWKQGSLVDTAPVAETMMNSDMGLYRTFNVDEQGLPERGSLWCVHQDSRVKCPKNEFKGDGHKPMYQIVEEYAYDGDLWIGDFVAAYEKMVQNGYRHGELQDAPSTAMLGTGSAISTSLPLAACSRCFVPHGGKQCIYKATDKKTPCRGCVINHHAPYCTDTCWGYTCQAPPFVKY
jgi:hypothetical protein